jgi:hypothetical protein
MMPGWLPGLILLAVVVPVAAVVLAVEGGRRAISRSRRSR